MSIVDVDAQSVDLLPWIQIATDEAAFDPKGWENWTNWSSWFHSMEEGSRNCKDLGHLDSST